MAVHYTTTNYLSVRQAAEVLGLSQSTVYRLVADGELPAHKFGGSIRIDADRLTALSDAGAAPTPRTKATKP